MSNSINYSEKKLQKATVFDLISCWSILGIFYCVMFIYNYQGQILVRTDDSSSIIKSVKSEDRACSAEKMTQCLFKAMSFNKFPFFLKAITHR